MPFIVVAGLPGSGKSTMARIVGARVGLPVLDKDDFLDALFEERGIGDDTWRAELSREADEHFASAARDIDGACLVSWWRPAHVDNPSGTPTAWLGGLGAPLVQVLCECRVETAVERFFRRRRHPGHLDALRSPDSLEREFAALAGAVPIPSAPIITVDTERPVDLDALADQLLMMFAAR